MNESVLKLPDSETTNEQVKINHEISCKKSFIANMLSKVDIMQVVQLWID